jgi:glycosyltransferase involved in cell wall biosynthesis
MITSKKLISIIVPTLNEELNIQPFYKAVNPIIDQLSSYYNFEILFTDNHSTDRTFQKLKELNLRDPRIRVLRFSRNFGYQRSILTGYLNARGDAIIQLDCDLQDPPSLIPKFIEFWEKGYLVVYGIRKTRKESYLLNLARKIFYRFINYLSEIHLPPDVGDFRLVDKKIAYELGKMDDINPYLRGAIAELGFKQIGIPYNRERRERGASNFRFKDLCLLALDGILSHSIIPLRIASIFGLVISILTILSIGGYIIGKIVFQLSWPAGFTTLSVLILFSISVNALFLGIIGEYIGRIFQQVKKRSITIIDEEI